MTFFQRRLLYISFIAIFILAGAGILLYLQGYRLNTDKDKWQIERTGAIQADSSPKDANIWLNGKLIDEQTSATILSLRPGEYEIKLALKGYQPWIKKLNVNPSEVTFTGLVRLWPEVNNGQILDGENVTNSWLSPNGETLLYLNKPNSSTELWLLNLKSGQTRLLTRQASSEIISAEWNSSSRDLLIQENSDNTSIWRLFNLESNTWEDIIPPSGLIFNNIHWGEDRHTFYASTTEELYEINLRTQNRKMIWRERLIDFRIHDGLVFGIIRGAGEAINLKLINLTTLKNVRITENPILSTNVKFLTNNHDWLPLFDIDRHSMHLLRSPLVEEKHIRTLSDITTFSWTAENDLIITNNFEIWQYNFKEQSPSFVERLSTSLTGAQKYGKEPYILFFTNNEIWAIELDNRGERQRWLLGKLADNISAIFLSPDYKTITVQTVKNLYRLDLTPTHQTSLQLID